MWGNKRDAGCVGLCGGMKCRLCRYMWGDKRDAGCVGLCGGMKCRLCRYMWGINEMQAV